MEQLEKLFGLFNQVVSLEIQVPGRHHPSMKAARRLKKLYRFGRHRTSSAARSLPLTPAKSNDPRDLREFDYETRFGLKDVSIHHIFNQIRPVIDEELAIMGLQTHFTLDPWNIFLLCLEFLRRYEAYFKLGETYGISAGSVCKLLQHWLPVLRASITSTTGWFTQEMLRDAPYSQILDVRVAGAVDCCYMKRNRVHPRQELWYRGDKKSHGMLAQLICTSYGEIINVQLWKGHNCDMGVFRTGLVPSGPDGQEQPVIEWASAPAQNGFGLVLDGGYQVQSEGILNPISCPYDQTVQPQAFQLWHDEQKAHREIVERVFGRVWNWKSAVDSRNNVHLHAMCVIIVFWLVNEDFKVRPL